MGARPCREPSGRRPPEPSGEARKGLQRALEAARRENEQLLALYETALGLIHRIDQEELLEAVLQRAARLAGTSHGFIYLREGPELVMRVGMGFFRSQIGLRVAPGEGLGGRVWQSRAPLVVADYRHWEGRLPAKVFDELRSTVGLPLRYRNGVEGVIGLARVEPGRGFSREEVRLLERFAGLATVALDKARLIAEARNELAERRRTEAILRQSEERYRQLLESLPDPVVVYTLKGEALYVNPAFEQTFGYRREELLGRSIAFVPEENWPETRAAIEALLGGKKVLLETRRRTRQGRLLDVQLTSTLYFDEKGRPAGNIVILRDISDRKEAERRLAESRDALEERVAARTRELASANEALAREVEDRRRAEAKLRRREKQLKAQSLHLQEVNTALRVLLKQREQDRRELGEGVLANVRELIHPYLERLRQARLAPFQKALVDILESNLESIVSPFVSRLSSLHRGLTPTEVRVANLVREGKTNKEIAELLSISRNTVLFHRHNLRTKLGLRNTKRNLRTYLQGITE